MATVVIVICIVVVSSWLVSSVVGKWWESGRKWETLCKVDAHVWSLSAGQFMDSSQIVRCELIVRCGQLVELTLEFNHKTSLIIS